MKHNTKRKALRNVLHVSGFFFHLKLENLSFLQLCMIELLHNRYCVNLHYIVNVKEEALLVIVENSILKTKQNENSHHKIYNTGSTVEF